MDRDARDLAQRIEESVNYALRIVGPGDRSLESISEDDAERPAAA